jgi:hypothetical protein
MAIAVIANLTEHTNIENRRRRVIEDKLAIFDAAQKWAALFS